MPSTGFTLVEFVLVIAIIGILAAVGMPRFFTPQLFDDANARTEFQSALNLARNQAVTAQCSIEIRLDDNGWSAWRDQDAADSCDASNGFTSPAPACGDAPAYALRDDNGAALSGDLALDASVTTPVRLIFTARGQVHLLTSDCGGTLDASNRPIPNTQIALSTGARLRLDGITGYAALL